MTDGDTVRVLHASSALGTAQYEPTPDGKWNPTSGFSWTLRETEITEPVVLQRRQFYEANGWVASNMDTGTRTDMERRIALESLGPTRTLAVTYTRLGRGGLVVESWPTGLADGCASVKLIGGDPPAGLSFDSAGWARIATD